MSRLRMTLRLIIGFVGRQNSKGLFGEVYICAVLPGLVGGGRQPLASPGFGVVSVFASMLGRQGSARGSVGAVASQMSGRGQGP